MPSYTKPQILNFLDAKLDEFGELPSSPGQASAKWILFKFIRMCVANDIITPAMVNAAFTEFP